jgi:hypothetical protein
VPLAIYLARLAVKLGEAIDITLDIVSAFPRSHAVKPTSIGRQLSMTPPRVWQPLGCVTFAQNDKKREKYGSMTQRPLP